MVGIEAMQLREQMNIGLTRGNVESGRLENEQGLESHVYVVEARRTGTWVWVGHRGI